MITYLQELGLWEEGAREVGLGVGYGVGKGVGNGLGYQVVGGVGKNCRRLRVWRIKTKYEEELAYGIASDGRHPRVRRSGWGHSRGDR
eukprot:293708-Amorphochlora_amoeboformis.AAC.1